MRKNLNRILSGAVAIATLGTMFLRAPTVGAASFTAVKDTKTRLKVSVTSVVHSFSLAMPSAFTGKVLFVMDNDYASLAASSVAGTCTTGSVETATAAANTGSGTNTFSVHVTTCTGTLALTAGFTATNPSSTGSQLNYAFACANGDNCSTITNALANADHQAEFATATVTEDQVGVTATVDPSITFRVGADVNGTACDTSTSFSEGGTVNLGTLTSSAIATSDVSNGSVDVKHICTRVSTNATGGGVVTVKSTNGALASTSVPADTIPSASATITAGTANYGLCVGSGGSWDTGSATSTPSSANPTRTSPFDGSCTTGAHAVGAVTTSAQSIWSVSDPTSSAYARVYVKATISGTTIAHNDYADTLTFVATGTF